MEDERINFNSRKQGGESDELETRKIVRQYVPYQDYMIKIEDVSFAAYAEVEEDDRGNIFCVKCDEILYYNPTIELDTAMPSWMLASFPHDPSWTWGALIEREICRQAEELPGSAWKTEYEEENDGR